MPDGNLNGVNELVVLTRGPLQAEVYDPSGASPPLTVASYDTAHDPFDLEVLPDRTGDGIPELAALSGNPPVLRISDGRTGQALQDAAYSPWFYGQDLEVVPDLDNNGFEELAMLGEHNFNHRSDKVEIRNANGAIVQQFWLGNGWRVLEQVVIADINGNGSPEVALRRAEYENRGSTTPERSQIVIRDLMTRQELGVIDEGQPQFPTEQFLGPASTCSPPTSKRRRWVWICSRAPT